MSRYQGDHIKQIAFYVTWNQYEAVIAALDKHMREMEVESHSEAFLKLLGVKSEDEDD